MLLQNVASYIETYEIDTFFMATTKSVLDWLGFKTLLFLQRQELLKPSQGVFRVCVFTISLENYHRSSGDEKHMVACVGIRVQVFGRLLLCTMWSLVSEKGNVRCAILSVVNVYCVNTMWSLVSVKCDVQSPIHNVYSGH